MGWEAVQRAQLHQFGVSGQALVSAWSTPNMVTGRPALSFGYYAMSWKEHW
jgi:hypothetical protein